VSRIAAVGVSSLCLSAATVANAGRTKAVRDLQRPPSPHRSPGAFSSDSWGFEKVVRGKLSESAVICLSLTRKCRPLWSFAKDVKFALAVLATLFVAVCSSPAQTGAVLGQPALQKYINVGGGVDEINTGDLTVHISIPLASKGAYGPPVSTSLDMDSRTYLYNYNQGSGNQIFTAGNFQFRSSARFSVGFPYFNAGSGSCSTQPYPQLAAWPAYDGSGTFHPATVTLLGCGGTLGSPGNNGDGWAVGVALASSPYSPYWNYFGVAIAPSGLWGGIEFPPQLSGGCPPHSVEDLHSNAITDNLCWGFNSNGVPISASGAVTDAAGNHVLTASLSGSNVLLQYPGPSATTSTYRLTFSEATVNEDFGCPGLSVPSSYTSPLLTAILLPDGSNQSFTYESNSLHSGTTTGRIASITVPTGATYAYTYTGGTHGVNCSDGSTSGIKKVTPDGTWTLTHTAESGTTNLSTTTVKAPSLDYVIDTIVAVLPNPNTPFVIPQTSTVASLSYSSAGTLLASTYMCYSGNHPTSPLSCANPPSAPGFAPSEIDTWGYVPGVANPSLKVTMFDHYLRVTDVKTYGFGGTVGSTAYDTDVQTAYGSWNGTSCVAITNTLTGFGEYALMDRVCSKKTFVNGITTPISNSYYTYGASGNSFGELVKEQDTLGSNLVTVDTRTYDNLGRVLYSTGPNGETTTSTYAQCSGQQLDSASAKASAAGAVLNSAYSGYDCVGEKATTTTDANTNPSSVNFGTDPFWRPVSTTDADGNFTNYTYTPATGSTPATVDVQKTIVASSSSEETLTQFDSMGRVKLSQVCQGVPPCSRYTITETDYDSNGRVKRVTLPYSGAAGTTNPTIDGTTTTYDGLGRKLTVTGPAYSGTVPGSILTYTYPANDVLVTQTPAPAGEHAKARQTERNGLGQVTSVCEITTMPGSSSCRQSTAATGFETTYTYYPAGKLATIMQYANGSTQQVRSFTYDNNNTGRPLTTTTPESGTSTTVYDSDPSGLCAPFVGFAVKTIDNAGNTACFQYDLADRVISETFLGPNSGTSAPKSFVYDASSNSHLSCAKTNAAGKLVEIQTGTSTSAAVTISGSEQSVGADAAGYGYVYINGSEKSLPATSSTGTVSLNFSVYSYLGASITISVNGATAGSVTVPKGGSGCIVAPALASSINNNSGSLVSATSSCNSANNYGTVQLKSKANGSQTNYSLGCSGLCSYPYVILSGMSGGRNAVYDSGSDTITVNGISQSVPYGSSSTTTSVASALASAFNGDSTSPVSATFTSNSVTLTSKTTGSNTDYSLSVSSQTNDATDFGTPSFTVTPSGTTLNGGSTAIYDAGTVWITVNGTQSSISYGQNSTAATVATSLVNAITGNSTLPVTANLSGSTLDLTVKTGSTLNTLTSSSSTSQPSTFANPSFTAKAALGSGALATDELFCYDPAGRKTDTFQWTSNGYNAYGHISEAYYPNGVPKSISWIASGWPTPTPPTVNYALDSMGRPYSASDSNSNTLVSSTSYYLDNGVNTVTFGNGDKSAYSEYANFAPKTATHTIGTTSNNTIAYTPTWNSNGTVLSLQTIDKFNSAANSQTCSFSYDDLIRISTDNCGSNWNQSFSYDPFGNITKSGSSPWPPMGVTYNESNNRYSSGNSFAYDANGRLLNDTFDTLGWDVNGNLISQTGTSFQYDAFDRPVSSTAAGVTTSYVYAPDGTLIATLLGSSHLFSQLFIGLPASRAVYAGSTLALNHLDHYDWQESARVSSTWARTLYDDVSYDAFGMSYWNSGTSNKEFAGLTGDISSGSGLASESRRYHPSQGRWESPDDRIPDPYDPQSFNAYAYVNNLPTSMTDPGGHEPYLYGSAGDPSTINTDLNGMLVFYGGQVVDPNDYIGSYAEVDQFSNTATITIPKDLMNLPPITNTPYQAPIYLPSGDEMLGGPNVLYPSQMSQSDLKALDRTMTGINMGTTLLSAFTLGLTGPLTAGPAIETTGLTTVGPIQTIDACLAGCLSRAILRVNAEGLTVPQLAAVAKSPNLEAAMVGGQLDKFFKEEVLASGLGDSIQVTPRYKFGPDVFDTNTGKWWDVTTPGQWAGHVRKYAPGYGTGSPLFYGRTNFFVNPMPIAQ
jgi:RHS repeat-associated protein